MLPAVVKPDSLCACPWSYDSRRAIGDDKKRRILKPVGVVSPLQSDAVKSAIPKSAIPQTAIVVGGGVAGMSAACALAEAGLRVKLVEHRGYLGGRASSYRHPGVDEVIDNCQHVLFGCCTNLIGFYRRIGVAERIHWTSSMTMIEPGGRQTRLGSSRWLPLPLARPAKPARRPKLLRARTRKRWPARFAR